MTTFYSTDSIGGFTFSVKETKAQGDGAPRYIITEKNNPSWFYETFSAGEVQAFLRGVMIGAERHF